MSSSASITPRLAASDSSGSVYKPKRCLSAYNLYYRFKRSKILDACAAGNDDKANIEHLLKTTPGLEAHPHDISSMHKTSMYELCREIIKDDMKDDLLPRDTSKRSHTKTHGAMTFVAMGKIMSTMWKEQDDEIKQIFRDLAEQGRKEYQKLLKDLDVDVKELRTKKCSPKKIKVKEPEEEAKIKEKPPLPEVLHHHAIVSVSDSDDQHEDEVQLPLFDFDFMQDHPLGNVDHSPDNLEQSFCRQCAPTRSRMSLVFHNVSMEPIESLNTVSTSSDEDESDNVSSCDFLKLICHLDEALEQAM
eukprot:g8049.t1 g8049   contig27:71361-72354(-)